MMHPITSTSTETEECTGAGTATGRRPFQIPSLDGLRAVSFLIVFLGHAFAKRWIPGDLGLIVFFFLSGYLITTLLRMEFDETGRINFRDFYLRRVLRIFPPLYLVLGLDCVLTLTHVLDNTLWPEAVLAQACHLTNYWIVFHGWWYGMAPGSWIFWSLAVEEHFYLVFPLVYLLMRRRQLSPRHQALALFGLCAAVLAWRCLLVFGFHALKDRMYVATDTRVDSILFGCILAVWRNPALDPATHSERRLKAVWLPLALFALLASFAVPKVWPGFEQTFRYTVQGLALFPVFIAAVRYPAWGVFRWLNIGWVRTVGLLSYSLYLLHTTVLSGLHRWLHGSEAAIGALALVISLAVAALIYRGVEKPCARLRRRLSHVLAGRGRPRGGGGTSTGGGMAGAEGGGAGGRSGRVARNVLVTLATQLISWGLTFAVMLYLPRYVGDTGLGNLAFAASFVVIFGVFVPLGTSTVLVREIARDHDRAGELLTAALLLRLPLGLLMGAVAIVVASLLHYSPLVQLLVVLGMAGMIVVALNDALASALQGQENMTRQSAAVLVEKFLASGLTILLVLERAPLWTLAAVGLFTGMVSFLINASAFRSLLPTLRLPTAGALRALALAGMPFMGWVVFRTLYSQTDPVILRLVTNAATVGWYAAATRLVGTSLFLPVAITTALLPTLSRLHREDPAAFRLLVRRMLGLVMLFGIPLSLVLMLVPDRLIALLHYPAGFAHSIPVLRVGGFGVLLYYAAMVLGTAVIASDGQHKMMRASMIATVLSIPACFAGAFLAHLYWKNGAVGAILSDVLVEFYLVYSYLRMLPARTFVGESLTFLGRCTAAALPMAAFLELMSRSGIGLWIILPCVVIYGAMCLLLRCVSAQDLAMVQQILARRA